MDGWINNARSRGWSNEHARAIQEMADRFGYMLQWRFNDFDISCLPKEKDKKKILTVLARNPLLGSLYLERYRTLSQFYRILTDLECAQNE